MDMNLVKVVVDIAIFLEYTSSEFLNEDIAVQTMEQIAAELLKAGEEDRQELSRKIISLSSLYEPPQQEFVLSLPEALGLP